MDFLIGSGPIGSYTNGSGLGLVWSGPTSEESNLIGSYRIPDQTRPDKVRSLFLEKSKAIEKTTVSFPKKDERVVMLWSQL